MAKQTLPDPSRSRSTKFIRSGQRRIGYNIEHSETGAVKQIGNSKVTMCNIIKNMKCTGCLNSPPRKRVRETVFDILMAHKRILSEDMYTNSCSKYNNRFSD